MQFQSHPDCRLCQAHARLPTEPLEGRRHHVGVPTALYAPSLPPAPGVPYLIVLGQNPGFHESLENAPFVGPSGKLLKSHYLRDLKGISSIYLMNAARCGSWEGVPAPVHAEALCCSRAYIGEDLAQIVSVHGDGAIGVLLAVGAPASAVVGHLMTGKKFDSLTRALSKQGQMWNGLICHFTLHPAFCLRDRNGLVAVDDHMALVRRSLLGEIPPRTTPNIVPPRMPP